MIGRKGGIDIVSRVFARRFSRLLLASVVLTCISGCHRNEEIKVYRVAKAPLDSTPSEQVAMPTNAASPGLPAGIATFASANVATPPNWESQPLSQMRQASFLVHGDSGAIADISFVSLGPAAGNVLDNVNRWLGQLAQPPISAETLANTVQKLHTALGDVAVVDLTGKPENGDASKDGRIIAAIASDEARTSFFKMRGNAELVEAEKANFLKWVNSMRSGGADETKVASSASNSDKPQIKWEIPPGWSSAPASAMRYASFAPTDESGGKIDISVVTFPGDGGSDLDNVNRWRRQIGLPATDESAMNSEVAPLKTAAESFSTIDLVGTNSRMLAAWTRHDGHAWFFKLTGPNTAVEKEKPNFMKFIQSIRF